MDIKELRKADLITSIIITAFGIFVIVMATRMPMSASHGGVKSIWYVAPALFPLFIGSVLTFLGTILFVIAVRAGALRNLFDAQKENLKEKTEKNIRVWITACTFGFLVYVYIPNFDFSLCLMVFLFALIGAFYPENNRVMHGVFIYFLAFSIFLGILTFTGIINQLESINNIPDDTPFLTELIGQVSSGDTSNVSNYFGAVATAYIGDIVLIIGFVLFITYAYYLAKKNEIKKSIMHTVLIISIVFPLIICPIFRYPLRTNLPLEGIVISEGMHSIRDYIQNLQKESENKEEEVK